MSGPGFPTADRGIMVCRPRSELGRLRSSVADVERLAHTPSSSLQALNHASIVGGWGFPRAAQGTAQGSSRAGVDGFFQHSRGPGVSGVIPPAPMTAALRPPERPVTVPLTAAQRSQSVTAPITMKPTPPRRWTGGACSRSSRACCRRDRERVEVRANGRRERKTARAVLPDDA